MRERECVCVRVHSLRASDVTLSDLSTRAVFPKGVKPPLSRLRSDTEQPNKHK